MNYITVNSKNVLVTVPGNPISLSGSSLPCNRIDIQALKSNVGDVYIGGSSVNASTKTGICLSSGDVYSIEKITDIIGIYVDSINANDGISFNYWIGETV